MLFEEVAEAYEKIESTASRLEMRDLLAELFSGATCDELKTIVYLTTGRIYPEFVDVEFGVADRQILKAIYEATRVEMEHLEALYRKTGDLGAVAAMTIREKKQSSLFSESLTLEKVRSVLEELSRKGGKGSQQYKSRVLAGLFHSTSPVEAKYLARILVGKMRIGVAAMTILDALTVVFAGEENRQVVERAYNITSDIGLVAEILCKDGVGDLKELHVQVGHPLKAMLAERLGDLGDIMQKMGGKAAFEYKYDGLRMQVHIDKTAEEGEQIKMFSRQLEDLTSQFPELHDWILKAFKEEKGIVEGECVPVDSTTGEFLPFQVISRRRGRKHGLDDAIEEFPVKLVLFDVLLSGDREMIDLPFPERRKELERVVEPNERIDISTMLITDNPDEAQRFFMEALASGCEGLMAKSLSEDSGYRAGNRGWIWIKYKKEYRSEMVDTVDLVVVGAFAGRGRRADTYGALLMASYNPEENRFETVCKLGSGFDDTHLSLLPEMLKPHLQNFRDRRVESLIEADYWFRPGLVLEVIGAEITHSPAHTCARDVLKEGAGLSIRFPRFTGRFREDKGPEDATTSQEIVSLYRAQMKKT